MGNTLNQTILERSIRHQFNVQRYSSKLVSDLLGLLNASDDDLEAKIRSRLTTDASGSATTKRLQQLQAEIRAINSDAMQRVSASLPSRLGRFAVAEEQAQRDIVEAPLRDILGYRFKLTAVSADTLAGIVSSRPFEGRLLSGELKKLSEDRAAAVIGKLNTGLAQGSSIEEIVTSIMGRTVRGMKGQEPAAVGGALDVARKDLRSIVRTYASHVANETRDDLFRANSDVISGQMWVATLDENTTSFCQKRDGLIYDLDHKPVGHDLPWGAGPGRAHWNCRSTSVPVIKAAEDLPIDWSRIGAGKGKRAAVNRDDVGEYINGEAPESSDYTSWLRDQPERVQQDVLGKARAKWFNENPESSVAQAWAQDFKVRNDDHLTLRELVAKTKEDPGTQPSMAELRATASLTTADLPQIEQALLGQGTQTSFLFNAGDALIRIVDGGRIPRSAAEALDGGTLVTNHVDGLAFSPDEIGFAAGNDLAETRAVGINANGTSYLYTAGPGEDGWPAADAVASEADRLEEIVRNFIEAKVEAGELSRLEADQLSPHELMRRLSQSLGFSYSRTRIL